MPEVGIVGKAHMREARRYSSAVGLVRIAYRGLEKSDCLHWGTDMNSTKTLHSRCEVRHVEKKTHTNRMVTLWSSKNTVDSCRIEAFSGIDFDA